MKQLKIVLIGAGRVSWHLAKAFHQAGRPVDQLVNRHPKHLKGWEAWAPHLGGFSDIFSQADLYILAVSDQAITEVASRLKPLLPDDAFLVHTSGATPSTILSDSFSRIGVFYPLQSFTKGKAVDFQQIPICIYANHPEDQQQLQELAQTLTILEKIYSIDDQQRASLHLAAVFVNNFVNHLYGIGYQLSQDFEVPFDLLRPLILETAQKVQKIPPQAAQTGPALRGDQETIEKHLRHLENYPYFRQLYQQMTTQIQKSTP